MSDVEVSGNENLNLTASSPNADRSTRKGKSPMNEAGEESELQNLKLHDNMESKTAHNIIDIPNMVIPQNSTPYSITQVRGCCKISASVQCATHFPYIVI